MNHCTLHFIREYTTQSKEREKVNGHMHRLRTRDEESRKLYQDAHFIS
jgi:hypothetical protein